jgi:hypothetical protein
MSRMQLKVGSESKFQLSVERISLSQFVIENEDMPLIYDS